MGRPRGKRKTARVTVNLDENDYVSLLDIANRNDVPVAQLARKAVVDYLRREESSTRQGVLSLASPQLDG